MRVIAKDLRRGAVRVRVECPDDLWVLKTVVREGDVVIARTLRDVKVDGEGKRRLPMVLAVRVKNVYFQPFATRLRIHGVIVDGPETYGLRGSHHTFNVDVGSEVEVVKGSWSPSELGRLARASRRWVRALLVAADFDEVSVATLYQQGVRYLLDRGLPGVSVRDPNSIGRVADEVVKLVLEVLSREEVDVVVVGSPAVLREYIADRLSKLVGGKVRVYRDSVSAGGRHGVEELIRRDVVKNILRDVAAIEVEEILNEFMAYLSKGSDRVAYGLEAVKAAVKSNAVRKLLISEDLLSGPLREEVEALVSEAEGRGALVRIVPTESPTSTKVKALGGVVAILRYGLDLSALVPNP